MRVMSIRTTLSLLILASLLPLVVAEGSFPEISWNGFLVGADGTTADFNYAGDCNGPGAVTLLWAWGSEQIRVESVMSQSCGFFVEARPFTWKLSSTTDVAPAPFDAEGAGHIQVHTWALAGSHNGKPIVVFSR